MLYRQLYTLKNLWVCFIEFISRENNIEFNIWKIESEMWIILVQRDHISSVNPVWYCSYLKLGFKLMKKYIYDFSTLVHHIYFNFGFRARTKTSHYFTEFLKSNKCLGSGFFWQKMFEICLWLVLRIPANLSKIDPNKTIVK